MVSNGRPGFCVWITGLPASGKSTVTAALVRRMQKDGENPTVLESDVMRKILFDESHYEDQERDTFYRSLTFIAGVLTGHGVPVIIDATANRKAWRDRARAQIDRFIEVFVDVPLEVCMQRDPKGIYRSALAGSATNVPGLQAAYEPPENPEVVIRGDKETVEESSARIVSTLRSKGFL